MRKLGVSAVFGMEPEIPMEEQMPLMKQAGFDTCFGCYNQDEPIEKWAETAARLDLPIETLHAPFGNMNSFWEDTLDGEEYLKFQMTRVDGCRRIGVDQCVMHVTIASVAPPVNALGLARFRRLSDYAREQGVHLCYENLELPEHLSAVMGDNPDYHGFCWDCGHNYCYTPLWDMMALYGNRLLCVHVHDNFGVRVPGRIHYDDDLHLLPMDGGLDWAAFADRIKASGFQGPISLELSKYGLKGVRDYSQMTLMEYLTEAHKRAVRLRAMCGDKA